MTTGLNALSRNPNICASCSSLVDGMDDLSASDELLPTQAPQTRLDIGNQSVHHNEPAPNQPVVADAPLGPEVSG